MYVPDIPCEMVCGIEFYGPETRIVAQDRDHMVLKAENETGEGTMTLYSVFPGIDLLYNDIHMTIMRAEQDKKSCDNMMEINHCREGRFEYAWAVCGCIYRCDSRNDAFRGFPALCTNYYS